MLYNCCVRIKFWIDFLYVFAVEAYTASWIEIPPCNNPRNSVQSRLIQPRGLKYFSVVLFVQSPDVEAYTASWIEITARNPLLPPNLVEAYTASWIEIHRFPHCLFFGWSRLIQPRGLKYDKAAEQGLAYPVEAYTASWIEMWTSGSTESER